MKNKMYKMTNHNQVTLFKDSDDYYAKYLAMIKSATISIHLQTYIFEMDTFGSSVASELLHARMRGVEVYLIVDGIGSRNLPRDIGLNFKRHGIHFYRFNILKISSFLQFARRLHHKILIIDDACAMVGGINVFKPSREIEILPRLDFAVFLRGSVVNEVIHYCEDVFWTVSKQKVKFKKMGIQDSWEPGLKVGLSINDKFFRRTQIAKLYNRLINEAQNEISIINSYFFPSHKLKKQLIAAVNRGVRVKLILPLYSDWRSYIYASEYLYEYLLKNGIEVYQWKKSILHGKLATVDDSWATIGSFNLNFTSYQQNLELNINIFSEEFTRFLNAEIQNMITDGCDKIELDEFKKQTNMRKSILRYFFYTLLTLVSSFTCDLLFLKFNSKNNN